MNAAFLLVCTLSLGQSVPDVSMVAARDSDLDGTYSVLVKTTTLADGMTAAAAPENLASAPRSPAGSPGHDVAEMAALERDSEASKTSPVLTPVTPGDRSLTATGGDAAAGHRPVALASNTTTTSTLPAETGTSELRDSAKRLLKGAFSVSSDSTVAGTPLSLRDAIAGTIDRQMQLQIVSAYWQLSAAVAEHQFAAEEMDWLANVVVPETGDAATKLAAARAIATAELSAAELSVLSKQIAMAEMVSNGVSSQPVVPTDLPLAIPYRTQFESLFVGRPAPAGLHRIHRVLPLRLAAIEARARAVEAADKLVAAAESAFVADEISLDELLARLDGFRSQRQAFIVAVRDYNVDIAAYALAVAGNDASHNKIVSMLIETPPTERPAGSLPTSQTPVTPGVHVTPVMTGQPTLATAPGEASVPTAPVHSPPVVPVTSEPTTDSPPVDDATVTTTNSSPPPTAAGASAFRDVTPSAPARPEVLVPLEPARYR